MGVSADPQGLGWRPSTDVVCAEVGTEMVLLNTVSGVYYALNPVATVVWKALRDGHSVSDLRALVLREFDVNPDLASADVDQFLAEAARLGLVTVAA